MRTRKSFEALSPPPSVVLRDVLRQVLASTRPEPHHGHKAKLTRELEAEVAYEEAKEDGATYDDAERWRRARLGFLS